jgi:hypothetical protein
MKRTKKIILFISIIFAVFFIATSNYSNSLYNYGFWSKIIDSAIPMLIAFSSIIIFIFSLITYFLKDEIFKPWLKFTYIWLPLSIIFTLITPGGSGSFFVSLWDKEMTVIFMSALYVVVSITMLIINVIRFYFLNKNKTDII